MKLAMIEVNGSAHPAVVLDEERYIDLAPHGFGWRDLEQIIEGGEEVLREIKSIIRSEPPGTEPDRLLAPLTRPEKIMCIGKNYADHCREFGSPLPDRPVLFAKYRNALAGPGAQIELPSVSGKVDYEAELAVVIGRKCKNIGPKEALSAVFGYTCANDLTMRDAQAQDGQWTRAKSPDSFCPVGPVIVTADEISDPQNLSIRLTLNGKEMQNSNTGQMVFPVAELVSYLSATMTLVPGDLLLTGTPSGVGMGRKPAVFLKGGDLVSVEIEGLGRLENRMKAQA
ncbi:MAG TPA: fumarylacetoacetate hydrolase family protein [archaeon]|nr:fumarylacetoacetate hydrolase family protein [archaeon]